MIYYIEEHKEIPSFGSIKTFERSKEYPDGFPLITNASAFEQKYFFIWNKDRKQSCYTAHYVIGAQRVDNDELVIIPKMDNVDFMQMFSVCLANDPSPDELSKIYDIDLDAKPIQTRANISLALTPLLIVHFLMLMKHITSRGLRSDYVERDENLKKIRGKIDIRKNEKENINYRRFDRVYCQYCERSINIPENRLFKKTLLVCKRYINEMVEHRIYPDLSNQINRYLSVFDGVEDDVEWQEIRNSKRSVLYRDYATAVRVALEILKQIDCSVSNNLTTNQEIPVFWIDMSLLFEHYVYTLLYKAYGEEIKYQEAGLYNWKPDYLHLGEKLVIDAKYIPALDDKRPTGNIIRQLSGYSRLKSFTKKLGVDDDTIVPCVILYPLFEKNTSVNVFEKEKKLLSQATPIESLIKFYKIGVPIPQIE